MKVPARRRFGSPTLFRSASGRFIRPPILTMPSLMVLSPLPSLSRISQHEHGHASVGDYSGLHAGGGSHEELLGRPDIVDVLTRAGFTRVIIVPGRSTGSRSRDSGCQSLVYWELRNWRSTELVGLLIDLLDLILRCICCALAWFDAFVCAGIINRSYT